MKHTCRSFFYETHFHSASKILFPFTLLPPAHWVRDDFKRFMKFVEEDLHQMKVKGAYDKVLNKDDIIKYIKEKKIFENI